MSLESNRPAQAIAVLGADHSLVSQLVSRIEHLSSDVSNFDTTRQIREDNLLLRKDLQAYQVG